MSKRPRRCTCPADTTKVGRLERVWRAHPGRKAMYHTARRITHYGPGDQIAWHWSDTTRWLTSNTWYRWLP